MSYELSADRWFLVQTYPNLHSKSGMHHAARPQETPDCFLPQPSFPQSPKSQYSSEAVSRLRSSSESSQAPGYVKPSGLALFGLNLTHASERGSASQERTGSIAIGYKLSADKTLATAQALGTPGLQAWLSSISISHPLPSARIDLWTAIGFDSYKLSADKTPATAQAAGYAKPSGLAFFDLNLTPAPERGSTSRERSGSIAISYKLSADKTPATAQAAGYARPSGLAFFDLNLTPAPERGSTSRERSGSIAISYKLSADKTPATAQASRYAKPSGLALFDLNLTPAPEREDRPLDSDRVR